MTTKQLWALCVCMFAIATGIGVVFGVMPLYVAEIGVEASASGLVLSAAYLALAASTVVAGQLSRRFGRRTLFLVASGALAVPLAWSLRFAATLAPLVLVLVGMWFAAGVAVTMTQILAGLFAEADNRGRVFGWISFSNSLGLFFGLLISGPVADRWGFAALWAVLAANYALVPCVGLLLRDRQVAATDKHRASGVRDVMGNRTFAFLFIASVVGQASNVVIALGRPLLMQTMRFDATAITTVGALGIAVSIPLSLVIGRASDRWGRMPFLYACFAATPVGLAILAVSQHTWQFWVAGVAQTCLGVGGVVGSALLADTFSDSLDTALAFYNATPWIGIVIGLGAAGIGIDALGMTATLMTSLAISLIAIALLAPLSMRPLATSAETR